MSKAGTPGPDLTFNFLDKFDKAVINPEDFPIMGQIPKDDRLQRLKYRILVIYSYLAFYVVRYAIVKIRNSPRKKTFRN
ncbi:MAG: hypothetical protein C4538_02005 [Nitrospiraceae bacterium]|nr:MAG: hypothetical protein C4538_02005 [Nitrospiraceae bacterium]